MCEGTHQIQSRHVALVVSHVEALEYSMERVLCSRRRSVLVPAKGSHEQELLATVLVDVRSTRACMGRSRRLRVVSFWRASEPPRVNDAVLAAKSRNGWEYSGLRDMVKTYKVSASAAQEAWFCLAPGTGSNLSFGILFQEDYR